MALDEYMGVKLTKDQKDFVEANGGSRWLRELIAAQMLGGSSDLEATVLKILRERGVLNEQ